MAYVEREPDIQEIPETASPLKIERKEVATPAPSQFTAKVSDDTGLPLIQTPASASVSIQIPGDEAALKGLAKGSPQNAITWFGAFWLRMIKKALYFGWKILYRR